MARPRKLPEGLRKRGRFYYGDFYANGRRVRKRLSGSLEAAKEILNDLKARADKADFNLLDNDYILKELKEQWLKHCKQTLKPASVSRYEGCLANILPSLAANRVSQITVEGVLAYRQERLDQDIAARTINMDVGALATMLRWGIRHALIGSNPLGEITPLPHVPKEGRALTDDEVTRLLETSQQSWRNIWEAFLLTGMRKEELAGLTFADVDWDNREIIVRSYRAKTGKERRIPIDTGLWDILKRQEAESKARRVGKGKTAKITERVKARFSQEHVFVSTQNTPLTHRSGLYNAFLRCCKAARIQVKTIGADGRLVDHVDLHSLRRTFATNLIANGADPKSVQELLGHTTLDMTMRIYTKIHAGTKRQALGKLSYGHGTLAPDHLLEYPGSGFSVQKSHNLVTSNETPEEPLTQVVGG